MQRTADLCSQATSFVQYKKRMANVLALKTYVKELAMHFRLRMRDRGRKENTPKKDQLATIVVVAK